ncbi:putative deacetylase LmbE-like domain-containing protein [Radiomyces spectabilis]|uniref:putative deacetylase LmbE-like domain-containing protein n=1 Tax=Radiomyces spectabilis TaxID=64574 RepID=UPI00221EF8D9|nr:putative deacetylase LmbE-like domain-containing protein [Radiomyces spectabilis]KAI8379505.1 putative deacetylase LmbE-like domain-containing protein [Radiomyces spectabilis]
MVIVLLCVFLVASVLVYSYHSLAHFQQSPALQSRSTLIVTAHPDDECMFFGPTIAALRSHSKTRIHLLCLSTGNADGLGTQRKKELVKSCQVLGIQPAQVKSLDHPDLQDGMNQTWSSSVVAAAVKNYVVKNKIDTVITFDDHGVSGHPNHIAAYNGAKQAASEGSFKLYKLVSIPLVRKYIGVADLMPITVQQVLNKHHHLLMLAPPGAYLISHKAMRQHASQLVWFRWLYVTFSRYMYVNELAIA